MSSLRMRISQGKPCYQLRFRHNGKQTSETFEDPTAAARWQEILDAVGPDEFLRLLDSERGAKGTGAPPLSVAGEEYITNLTGIENGTRKRYRAFMRNDVLPFFGDIPSSALGELGVARWVNWLQLEVGNSAKTIANKHGFLFALCASLVKKSILTTNPCTDTQLPEITAAEMCFLDADEFAALWQEIPERWRLLVKFMVAAGTRWGETTALRVGDVNPVQNTVHVHRAWKYTGGKRILGAPKTKRSNRYLNLDAGLVAELPLDGRKRSEFLFVNDNGDPIQITSFYKGVWVPTLDTIHRDARDPLHGKRPRIHDLRHTCASWMLIGGAPPHVVQAHLGHESITTTVDRYGHFDRRSATAAAAMVAAKLPGASAPAPGGPAPDEPKPVTRFRFPGLIEARTLAAWLTERIDVHVEYERVASTGERGQWQDWMFSWRDGPTDDEVRELISEVVESSPYGGAADIRLLRVRTLFRVK
ncbi:tyrosine-type recombinase/integrase [Nocardia niigatensis]|uniref:tyrosine-type recombinase/integrase n=1 Tax=Nocardia niigatensis TaxID=209249 RepID=UPI0002DBC8AC|nr:site-specific integrase [Nocardia niigatensis]